VVGFIVAAGEIHRGSSAAQNESQSGKSGCRLFHSNRASFNCVDSSVGSGSSAVGSWESLNFALKPNRRSSELDIRETEARAVLRSGSYVAVSQSVVAILSARAIVRILPAIGLYQHPLAVAVNQLYRYRLRKHKRKIIPKAAVR
jgi:hypothetical protein